MEIGVRVKTRIPEPGSFYSDPEYRKMAPRFGLEGCRIRAVRTRKDNLSPELVVAGVAVEVGKRNVHGFALATAEHSRTDRW